MPDSAPEDVPEDLYGALQPAIELGDLVITTGAVRLEATTKYFVHEAYPAVADYAAVAALAEAAATLGHRAHLGITATALRQSARRNSVDRCEAI